MLKSVQFTTVHLLFYFYYVTSREDVSYYYAIGNNNASDSELTFFPFLCDSTIDVEEHKTLYLKIEDTKHGGAAWMDKRFGFKHESFIRSDDRRQLRTNLKANVEIDGRWNIFTTIGNPRCSIIIRVKVFLEIVITSAKSKDVILRKAHEDDTFYVDEDEFSLQRNVYTFSCWRSNNSDVEMTDGLLHWELCNPFEPYQSIIDSCIETSVSSASPIIQRTTFDDFHKKSLKCIFTTLGEDATETHLKIDLMKRADFRNYTPFIDMYIPINERSHLKTSEPPNLSEEPKLHPMSGIATAPNPVTEPWFLPLMYGILAVVLLSIVVGLTYACKRRKQQLKSNERARMEQNTQNVDEDSFGERIYYTID